MRKLLIACGLSLLPTVAHATTGKELGGFAGLAVITLAAIVIIALLNSLPRRGP